MIHDRAALLAHLDALFIPHASPIRRLAKRFGALRPGRYGWPEVHLDGARPLVPSQDGPLSFRPEPLPDRLPPPALYGHARTGDYARANHDAALGALEASFGPARETSATNTIEHAWSLDGGAELVIRTFPPELQDARFRNPAFERDPRLSTGCHITVRAGHVPPLRAEEHAWMRQLEPIATEPSARAVVALSDVLIGTTRRLPEELRRAEPCVGPSSDRAAIVGLHEASGFVIEARDLLGLHLTRLEPARGPGGASLTLRSADPFASDRAPRSRTIFTSARPDGLDRTARALENALGVTLHVESALDD